jgi:methyltransferase
MAVKDAGMTLSLSQIAYVALLGAVGAGRLIELRISARNQRRMEQQGATRVRDFAFAWMLLWQGGALIAAAAEVVFLAPRFRPALGIPATVLFLLANALRWWVIRTLAVRWNVQVMSAVAQGVVSTGPYRWIRHPNYLAVFVEMVSLPLIHTAWRSAIFVAVSTTLALAARLRVEERVLLADPVYLREMGHKARFVPGLF